MNEIAALFEELTGFETLDISNVTCNFIIPNTSDFVIQNQYGKLATIHFHDGTNIIAINFNINKEQAARSYFFNLDSMDWIDKFQKKWEEWKDKKIK